MYLLKKTITSFILPPGIFIISLLSVGIWFLSKKKWKMGAFHCVMGCLMWAFSITPISNSMLRFLETGFQSPKNPRGDVVILLGGSHGLERVSNAINLQKRLNIPIISCGGEDYKDYIIKLVTGVNRIIFEEKSRDTFENALLAKEICERNGFKRPIIVTSAYHIKRAILSFQKVGMEVIPFPSNYISFGEYEVKDFLPNNYEKTSIALKEFLGLFFYRYFY